MSQQMKADQPSSQPSSPFIVLSLPRSRSAWLSHFLRYGGSSVGHDLATSCESVDEFLAKLAFLDGTCETGAVLGWRVLLEELPSARIVVILRDPKEVQSSLARFGLEVDLEDLSKKWLMLHLVSQLPGVLTVEYHQLSDPLVCKELFEFCLDLPFDWNYWENFHRTNIQVDMGQRLYHLVMNQEKIARLKAEIALRTGKLGGSHQCLN